MDLDEEGIRYREQLRIELQNITLLSQKVKRLAEEDHFSINGVAILASDCITDIVHKAEEQLVMLVTSICNAFERRADAHRQGEEDNEEEAP